MKKFSKIRQAKDCLKGLQIHFRYVGDDAEGRPIYDHLKPLPTVIFDGTVKNHGTNAGIRYNKTTDTVTPQKRTEDISIQNDNFGFASYTKKHESYFLELGRKLCDIIYTNEVTIFGEFSGKGIQKSVAVGQLDKFFYIFAVYCEEHGYVNIEPLSHLLKNEEARVYNAYQFPSYSISIDLNDPQPSLDLINRMVDSIDKECPIGKQLGVTGPGEGIVWRARDDLSTHTFKVKGSSHQKGGGKKATTNPIVAENVRAFVEKTVTEARLEQCFSEIESDVGEVRMEHIGDLVKWMIKDILDEEGDALAHNDLEAKQVSGMIGKASAGWFKQKINTF